MDKKITRMANRGVKRVLMFGRWWDLSPGTWGVRVARKPGPPRLIVKPDPNFGLLGMPEVEFKAGRPVLDVPRCKVHKINDDTVIHPDDVGGRYVRVWGSR